MKQLTDAQLLWDEDVQRLRDAEATVSAAEARMAELEGMLRAREKVCFEQADQIRHLESRVVTASVPPTPRSNTPATGGTVQPENLEFYVHVAENAKRKAEKLERENLELQVEVERLKRIGISDASGASSLF